MSNDRPLLLALACAVSLGGTSTLLAQSEPVRIGITAQGPTVLEQDDNCRVRACPLTIAPIGAQATAAGGTAFDATVGGVWVSNGIEIVLVDGESCRELCPPQRLLADRAFITGLAVYEPGRQLVVTDSANRVHLYPLDCPLPARPQTCSLAAQLPANHTLGGVAVDDVTGTLYLSSANLGAPANPGNLLWVTSISAPCQPRCFGRIPDCGTTPLVPVHGVAFDGCTGSVWITDGLRQVELRVDPRTCSIRELRCCSGGFTDPLAGLCILPGDSLVQGPGCVARPCRACPSPTHVLGGAPLLGNPAFELRGEGLPVGSSAFAVLNAGRCQAPGSSVPGLCGPLLMSFATPPIVLGPVPVTGAAFCDGAARIPVPIPADPLLCDLVLCSQLLGLCPAAAGTGTYVTPARQWRLTWH